MIEPVSARVLKSEWASSVIPAPYDALTPEQRTRHLRDHPHSFAHVAGSPAESFGHPTEHLQHASRSTQALDRLIGLGVFGAALEPCLYVQRIEANGHAQCSLLGAVRLDRHELRPHEDTQPGRVHGLEVHFTEVGQMSSPVVVTAPNLSAVTEVIDDTLAATQAEPALEPLLDARATDGARVTLWRAVTSGATEHGAAVDRPLYIVDGHHRVAAARQAGFSSVLVACAPTSELHLGSFDRSISELDIMPRRVTELLGERCDLSEVDGPATARPAEPGYIGIGIAGRWFRAGRRDAPGTPDAGARQNVASQIDAAFVHDVVLGEVFGITHPSDSRLSYRPTSAALSSAPVLLMLAPVQIETVFAIADQGGVMPPKTTYFLPKARSGLLLVEC